MATENSPNSTEPQLPGTSPGLSAWILAVGVACIVGWLGYNYPPIVWRIPDDMIHIGALSPPEDQAKLHAVEVANKWKNTLLKFSLAGLGIGLSGALLYAGSLSRHLPTAGVTLGVGVVAGAVSGVISLVLRQYLDLEYPLPLISDQMRPLFCDAVVFGVGSAILLLPVSALLWMRKMPEDRQKALAVPLAGLLTGILVPTVAAVVSPKTNTTYFPPMGLDLTFIWFAVLAVITVVLLMMVGKKPVATNEAIA